MIVASLLADLERHGARVSSRDGEATRLVVEAPPGALTDSLRGAIRRHKGELLALIIELEETRAIVEENGATPEEADRAAREALHISTATPDGQLYLRDLAENDEGVRALCEIFDAEIISVERQSGVPQWRPPYEVSF